MSHKHRDKTGQPNVHRNAYAGMAGKPGNKQRERLSRGSSVGGSEVQRAIIYGEKIADRYGAHPRELIIGGVLYELVSVESVVEQITRRVPGGTSFDWFTGRRIQLPDREVTTKETTGYKGKYEKVRELSFFEIQQRRTEAEKQRRREERKNRPLVEKLRDGMPIRDQF